MTVVALASIATILHATDAPCASLDLADSSPAPAGMFSSAKTITGVRVAYHTFNDSRMEDSYGNTPYLMAEFLVLAGHHGISLEVGYLYREGEPARLPTEWNVLSTSLSMWAVPFAANYLFYITEYGRSSRFAPYVGLGLGTFLGGEKIGATATTLLKRWDGWTWGIRGSFIGNAIIGAHIKAIGGFDAVVELRWIQSGKGGNIDLVEEEDEPLIDEYLYPLVQRSSYDFTGWSVSVGVRW